jgi:hypothetical protein
MARYCRDLSENCQCCWKIVKVVDRGGGEDLKCCHPEKFLVCQKIFSVCQKVLPLPPPPPKKKHGSHGATDYIKSKCTSLCLNVVCTCLYNCIAGTERAEKKVSYYIVLKYIQTTNSNLLSD